MAKNDVKVTDNPKLKQKKLSDGNFSLYLEYYYGYNSEMDKASGKSLSRPGYQSLKVGIGKLVTGDTLYIKSLDRLSRNKEDLKKELQYFKDKGIKVKILDMPTTMTDFPAEQAWIGDMITNIMIEVLSSIAQNERETTRQRQLEGLAAMPTDSTTGKKISRRTGKPIGRPPITYPKKWESVYKDWQEKRSPHDKPCDY